MHCYTLSLGSNSGDRAQNLTAALQQLLPHLEGQPAVSPTIESPSTTGIGTPYLNLAARVKTTLEPDELKAILKQIETNLGRTPQSKSAGQIPIDIDIVICDNGILRLADYRAAHFRHCLSLLPDD